MERGNKNTKQDLILTNDPSMTGWGWAVVTPLGKVIAAGCIKTSPEHKKKRIRKGDDTVRRIRDITTELLRVIEEYSPRLMLSELPHGSQNASAAVMIGVVTGIGQVLSQTKKIPIEWYSEQDSKKFTLGKKAATKQEMIDKVASLVPSFKPTGIKYKDEAVADAISVFLTAQNQSPLIQLLMQ